MSTMEVTPDSPTTCTYCGARLRWDGREWMHWHGDLRPADFGSGSAGMNPEAIEAAAKAIGGVLITRGSTTQAAEAALVAAAPFLIREARAAELEAAAEWLAMPGRSWLYDRAATIRAGETE